MALVQPNYGISQLVSERFRQITEEGYSVERDAQLYLHNELAYAASCYLDVAIIAAEALESGNKSSIEDWMNYAPAVWPWDKRWWKPSKDPIRNLEKAGALIAAQIDVYEKHKEKENSPDN